MSTPPIPHELGPHFAVHAALAQGVTQWRLRGAGLERPFHGGRMIATGMGEPDDNADPARALRYWRDYQLRASRAYAEIMPPHQFFFGVTAAIIHELPVPALRMGRMSDISVGVHHPKRAPRRPGVNVHQFRERLATTQVIGGLRVLDSPSLWATLSTHLRLEDRIALGDAIIRTPRVGGRAASRGVV